MAAKSIRKKHWYDYLWIWTIVYFALGFFNILFAWLGMIDFILPLIFAAVGGNKWFCNHMCGRGQLFWVLGRNLKCSRRKPAPKWLSSKWFRYGFLAFFLTMFGTMVFQTYLVFSGAESPRTISCSDFHQFQPWQKNLKTYQQKDAVCATRFWLNLDFFVLAFIHIRGGMESWKTQNCPVCNGSSARQEKEEQI